MSDVCEVHEKVVNELNKSSELNSNLVIKSNPVDCVDKFQPLQYDKSLLKNVTILKTIGKKCI